MTFRWVVGDENFKFLNLAPREANGGLSKASVAYLIKAGKLSVFLKNVTN